MNNDILPERVKFVFLDWIRGRGNILSNEPTTTVTINRVSGDSWSLDVSPNDTVEQMKHKISLRERIPIERQILFSEESALGDEMSMKEFIGNKIGDPVAFLLREKKVHVQSLTDEYDLYDIGPEDNVGKLMSEYYKQTGVPPEKQRMIYGGLWLQSDEILGFELFDTAVYMVKRLRGGARTRQALRAPPADLAAITPPKPQQLDPPNPRKIAKYDSAWYGMTHEWAIAQLKNMYSVPDRSSN